MEEGNQVIQEFLPRFNQGRAVTPEQPEKAYRTFPGDLSLTEMVSTRNTRRVARENTVRYQCRKLQLPPGAQGPGDADLRLKVLAVQTGN